MPSVSLLFTKFFFVITNHNKITSEEPEAVSTRNQFLLQQKIIKPFS